MESFYMYVLFQNATLEKTVNIQLSVVLLVLNPNTFVIKAPEFFLLSPSSLLLKGGPQTSSICIYQHPC